MVGNYLVHKYRQRRNFGDRRHEGALQLQQACALCRCINHNQRRCVPTFWLLPGHLPTTRSRTLQMWASGTFLLDRPTPSPVFNVSELQSAWFLCKSCACTMYRHHETHARDLTSFGISKSRADGKRKEGVLEIIVPRCLWGTRDFRLASSKSDKAEATHDPSSTG